MAHIFFIDPLEKLNIKKDSTLLLALKFKEKGHEVGLLFEKDFYINNQIDNELVVYSFDGKFKEDGIYIDSFELKDSFKIKPSKKDVLHMRIDPPFDTRYLRYLWMLDFLQERTGVRVLNNPRGIMIHNEKLDAYKLTTSVESYVGSSLDGFMQFVESLKKRGETELILKPLDLYSGIGVEKVSIEDAKKLEERFLSKVKEFFGAIVAQPFMKEVYEGEHRSIYYNGLEIGTIIKKPNKGEFLSNIAQGAKFEKSELVASAKLECERIAKELLKDDVNFIAFDILGDKITEINITCPGLLVEVSYAYEKDFAGTIAEFFNRE